MGCASLHPSYAGPSRAATGWLKRSETHLFAHSYPSRMTRLESDLVSEQDK